MHGFNRRSTPKVVDGRVQSKNRHKPTPTYWNTGQALPAVDKERAGQGYRHLLTKADILTFIDVVPEWGQLANGLNAILLAAGAQDVDGWYDQSGVVAICAWERDLWRTTDSDHYAEHAALYARLGVPCEKRGQNYLCKFTEETARAYQLLHVFLHELGHHHDRMTTRRQSEPGRGEPYAEKWALKHEATLWKAYVQKFGLA